MNSNNRGNTPNVRNTPSGGSPSNRSNPGGNSSGGYGYRRRPSKDNRGVVSLLIAIILILVLASAGLIVTVILSHNTALEVSMKYEEQIRENDARYEIIESENAEFFAKIDSMELELDALRDQLQISSSELVQRQTEIDELIADNTANDLEKKVAELEKRISDRNSKISELESTVEAYKSTSSVDLAEQTKAVNSLISKLMSAPRRVEEVPAADGSSSSSSVSKDAKVSLYYEDLTSGYKIEYNSGRVMFSASLIKAPYIWTLLRRVSNFEQNQLATSGAISYSESTSLYNLNRMWTYDSATMFRKGSGKIQKMEDGAQMTYLDLVKYSLEVSDNVAFGELRDEFGYTDFYSVAASIGVTSMSSSFNNLSAADAGKFLKEIYKFTESDEKYGTLMKNSLLIANHRIMIPAAVSPKAVAHKYGWDVDAYHDMGIVYDKHPYILVIMTDLDDGDAAANSFITGIASSVDKIHTNFYK